jgi:2-amino-4-hydroxy-6-hydroxymethyldihydropteridine diphosphokinase
MRKNVIYLSLGSNRGNRIDLLNRAMGLISQKIGPIALKSPVYETAPWGFTDEIPFLNLAAEVHTQLEPEQLLALLLGIERSFGRDRLADTGSYRGNKVYHSRTIDIDILFFNDQVVNSPDLAIPHPLIAERRFVLVPMDSICPDFIHPGLHQTIRQLLQACTDQSPVTEYLMG